MQNIPANDTGCVLASCTAAFSFPCLVVPARSPLEVPFHCWGGRPKDSWDRSTSVPAADESQVPEGSRAGWGHWPGALVWACWQPHWQKGPSCSQPCNPRLHAKGFPSGTMCRVPFLPPSKLSLMVTGRLLQLLTVFLLMPLWGGLCVPVGPPLLSRLSPGGPLQIPAPSACLEPCPAPACSSPALPRGFLVCPRASPQLLTCRQECLLTCPCVHTGAAWKEIPPRHEEKLFYSEGGQAQEILPRQVVESPFLEIFRTTRASVLINLLSLTLLEQEGRT